VAETTFGGMPQWLLEDYLVELGGARDGAPGVVASDGWTATLSSRRDGPPHGITRVDVRIDGPRADETLAALRVKAQRGGG
jgi:hypothetical protein